ncbi:alkaline phosphatase family protein [Pseudomonas sp. B329]|uniref:alkaline phosphatase family protein n=1 Tax=Pseudomonas sp. B329 TaxID=1553459 RepID=UPI002003CC53|nr:alkaline phosphatase family protein [Pseudomonas sp. B329]MCK3863839.1 twin-arginine translocation signal domain-containing protein [Pseudomonas sp. B329]
MSRINRRDFLKASATATLTAGAFAGLPASIRTALASIDPNTLPTSLAGIEHVIIFMQENRSYDHYFATLPGGRGLFDPRPVPLPTGKSVFFQTKYVTPPGKPNTTHYAPFKLRDVYKENSYKNIGLAHDWAYDVDWKNWDRWLDNRDPNFQGTQGYLDKEDIHYYHSLASAFTLCDKYHCSLFAGTNINRRYFWSGTSGAGIPQAVNYREGKYIVYNDAWEKNLTADAVLDQAEAGWKWETYADILESNKISWKVYQGLDNYGDNGLAYFDNFRFSGRKDKSGAALASVNSKIQKARSYAGSKEDYDKANGDLDKIADVSITALMNSLKQDVQNNALPAVSWIVAPLKYCEHPGSKYSTNAGEFFTEKLLEAITTPAQNSGTSDVWAKTVVFMTYDENDGYFDHVPAAMPPLAGKHNLLTDMDDPKEKFSPNRVDVVNANAHKFLGLGPRVPMLVISPLSVSQGNGRICSQLFDHTSVIRFLEDWLVAKGHKAEAVKCKLISNWRRAVSGNLVSTLNFSRPFPDMKPPKETVPFSEKVPLAKKPSKKIPENNPLPDFSIYEGKDKEAAIACAMPFHNTAWGKIAANNSFSITYSTHRNTAEDLSATFITYKNPGLPTQTPFHLAVSNKTSLTVDFESSLGTDGYKFSVYGDNGFYRFLSGTRDDSITVEDSLERSSNTLRLTIKNTSATPRAVKVELNNDYTAPSAYFIYLPEQSSKVVTLSISGKQNAEALVFSLKNSAGWYNVSVLTSGNKKQDGTYEKGFYRVFAGNVETFEGRVDPAIGYYREDVCNNNLRPNAKDNGDIAQAGAQGVLRR